MVSASLVY
jgi:hypothetical protein